MSEKIEIELLNWRIFEKTKFELPSQSFLLTGRNGSGKTSFLSAFYSLWTGQSFGGKLVQNLRSGSQYFGILTNQEDWYLTGKIGGTGRLQSSYSKPKSCDFLKNTLGEKFQNYHSLDTHQTFSNNATEWLSKQSTPHKNQFWPSALTYVPSDNTWFESSRTEKLTKLDQLLGQIFGESYQHALTKFNKSLKAKQKFLASCIEENTTGDPFLIHNLAQSVYENSIVLWQFRQVFWQELDQFLVNFGKWLATPIHKMEIKYQVNNFSGMRQSVDWNVEISPKNTNWQGLWTKEIVIGQVFFGAHRDDFEILVNDTPIQNYFSRGEMRLFVIFIKNLAATLIRGKSPVIGFFDDVFGELDLEREQILLRELLSQTDYFIATSAQEIPNFNQTFQLSDLQK